MHTLKEVVCCVGVFVPAVLRDRYFHLWVPQCYICADPELYGIRAEPIHVASMHRECDFQKEAQVYNFCAEICGKCAKLYFPFKCITLWHRTNMCGSVHVPKWYNFTAASIHGSVYPQRNWHSRDVQSGHEIGPQHEYLFAAKVVKQGSNVILVVIATRLRPRVCACYHIRACIPWPHPYRDSDCM